MTYWWLVGVPASFVLFAQQVVPTSDSPWKEFGFWAISLASVSGFAAWLVRYTNTKNDEREKRSEAREAALGERLSELELFNRDKLMSALNDGHELKGRCIVSLDANTRALQTLESKLKQQ